jgi:ribokinase
MKPQVVVVGSFVQDLTWNCATFPGPGETVIGTFTTGPGGKGSNQAVAAGRAGAATLFIGAVGRDTFAADARAFYKAEKINARFVEKPGHATGTAAILVSDSGQNEIVVALGANARLSRADLNPKLFSGAQVVVAQLESSLAATAFALKTARAIGATAVFNPAPMRADFDPAILKHVDILIPNEAEFTALVKQLPATGGLKDFSEALLTTLGHDDVHALARTFGPPVVIVTLGKRGCLVSQESGYTFIPAHRVKAVDTTGAGDAFVGGFSAGLVKFKGDLVAAARFGTVVAALSVTKRGTAPAMPRKREIDAFLKKTKQS